jgi:hypothetical protein
MNSIFPIIIGIASGTFISWIRYGYAILPVLVILTAIFLIRRAIDDKFRGSDKDSRRMTFFVLFWLTVAYFYLKPSGLDTFIPKMNYEKVEVGQLLKNWNRSLPNITFHCENNISAKRISIHTITPVTIKEALALIDEKAGANHASSQDVWGRSITGGPRITIRIKPGNTSREEDPGKTYFDGLQ